VADDDDVAGLTTMDSLHRRVMVAFLGAHSSFSLLLSRSPDRVGVQYPISLITSCFQPNAFLSTLLTCSEVVAGAATP